jgi:DNA-binding transcriptional MerR regulator
MKLKIRPDRIGEMSSIADAARMFGVERQTILQWILKGKLVPDLKIAGRRLFSRKLILDTLGIPYTTEVVNLIKEVDPATRGRVKKRQLTFTSHE